MASTIKVDQIQSTTSNVSFFNSVGTEYARFDSSGNLGIGTTSPTAIYGKTLQIASGTTEGSLSIVGSSGAVFLATVGATGQLIARGSSSLVFGSNDVERMRIDSSGNVGIGTSSPSGQLTLAKASDLVFTQNGYGVAWGGDNGSPRIYGVSSGTLSFKAGGGSVAAEIDSSNNLKFNSGYGSVATAYGCRAWVNFDGTTSPGTIRASGNISSITRNSTGDYTVNFTNAMPDVNYCSLATGTGQVGVSIDGYANIRDPATEKKVGSVRVQQVTNPSAGTPYNTPNMNVAIFR